MPNHEAAEINLLNAKNMLNAVKSEAPDRQDVCNSADDAIRHINEALESLCGP